MAGKLFEYAAQHLTTHNCPIDSKCSVCVKVHIAQITAALMTLTEAKPDKCTLPATSTATFVLNEAYFPTAKISIVKFSHSILHVSKSCKLSNADTQNKYKHLKHDRYWNASTG